MRKAFASSKAEIASSSTGNAGGDLSDRHEAGGVRMMSVFHIVPAVISIATLLSFSGLAVAQGIGLPGQSGDKPIEINAEQGIEWQQNNRAYIARGNARAAQGDVAVLADTLTAYYRETENGRTDIWRIDAVGRVRIVTPHPKGLWRRGGVRCC